MIAIIVEPGSALPAAPPQRALAMLTLPLGPANPDEEEGGEEGEGEVADFRGVSGGQEAEGSDG
jgi:hypothetical protein